ncbi:MAG: hypothetical protein ABSA49_16985 [Rhizomicrobium sp.]|jgi:hypothetical protein
MIDEPTADEAKDMYAHFGLAIYCSSVLEHGVANALLILKLLEGRKSVKTRGDWEALVDKHYEGSFAQTLGSLIKQLGRHHARSPALAAMATDLQSCVTERNFLAHHFWREHSERWFTANGRATMLHRLEKARDLFAETDKKLDASMQPFEDRFGLTTDATRREMELMKQEISEEIRPNDQ